MFVSFQLFGVICKNFQTQTTQKPAAKPLEAAVQQTMLAAWPPYCWLRSPYGRQSYYVYILRSFKSKMFYNIL